ncbi:hypothetical protein NDK50_04430 [Paraburkholderia bryophila]|uniref:hypothetical protein n=1 Tax=Paraburkholderia bryophila TaxID=420952 RepID=UPI00234B42F9|nr:hypothetical protein [Paraburkholderia bryophila]WCM20723.1 hypothetical protein NDK50_04430 [Paraburkholderia bryophila]
MTKRTTLTMKPSSRSRNSQSRPTDLPVLQGQEERENFLVELAGIGKSLHQEPLSERTNARQYFLVGLSLVTILLEFSVINANSVSWGGVSLNFVNSRIGGLVFGAGCLYTSAVYAASVFLDIQLYKQKIREASVLGIRLSRKLTIAENHRSKRMNEISAILDERTYESEKSDSAQARKTLGEARQVYMEKTSQLIVKLGQTENLSSRSRDFQEWVKYDEITQKMLAELEKRAGAIRREEYNKRLLDEYMALATDNTVEKFGKEYLKVFAMSKRMTHLKTILEMVVPLLLGTFATATTWWSALHF